MFFCDNDPLESIEMSRRNYNALRRAKIDTVGRFMQLSEEEMFGIKNLGAKSIQGLLALQSKIIVEGERKQNVPSPLVEPPKKRWHQ